MDFLWWRYASPNSHETHQAKLSQTLQGGYIVLINMININAIMIFVLSFFFFLPITSSFLPIFPHNLLKENYCFVLCCQPNLT